jgi:leucyl aminopeptidase
MAINSRLIPADFTPIPSQDAAHATTVSVTAEPLTGLDAIGYAVSAGAEAPAALGVTSESLAKAGFTGAPGQTIVLPRTDGPVVVAFGVGRASEQDHASLRDAGASLARATERYSSLGVDLGDAFALDPALVGQLVTEGVLLSRYRFTELQPSATVVPLEALDIVSSADNIDAVTAGVRTGRVTSRATSLARDLANNPPGHLTATRFGTVAEQIGPQYGLAVETFDKEQLIAMGCGGLLGVNAGSAEEPRMIKLTYSPENPTAHVGLVGKGIMYDAGGISLKPSDSMHLLMKMDMAGAAAIMGAMTALQELDCPVAVTAWLMCTDNMPSGTAMGLGDVLTIRNGTTVEIKNTDAEGRLVMADALVLATEDAVDAIVDVATLTGSALQTLGTRVAAVFGNNQQLVDRAVAASVTSDEPVWQLPLEHRYRPQLNSAVADMSNMGGPFNVAITAALFLNEFVGDTPWAHLDIAGTMQTDRDDSWRSAGATGFATRLLIDLLLAYTPLTESA